MQDRADDRRFIEVALDGGEALLWARGPVESSTAAVVLLHDRVMNARAWDLVMRRMPTGLAVVAPDLRGRGSAWRLPPSSGVSSHVLDLGRILDQLDLDHVIVVGHGFGAVVARAFRRRDPARAVMTVGILGSGSDPFHDVLGLGFEDRLEHRRHWQLHPTLAVVARNDGVQRFLDHGIAGPEDHHRWRVDLQSLIADDASAREMETPGPSIEQGSGFTRSIIVGSSRVGESFGPAGSTSQLLGADPVTVVLTPSGADAIAAQIRPLLGP